MKNKKNIKPLLTIGIPAYNEESNIKNLLVNLLSQKQDLYFIEKILLVSDGSTDDTVKEAESIGDKRIEIISHEERLGQNVRLNEIIRKKPINSDFLLIMEADTLPKSINFINYFFKAIPKNGKFSIIAGNAVPVKARKEFEKILNFGFFFRKEVFEISPNGFNVYLNTSAKLMSTDFLKTFKWSTKYHEDSYCFRCAKQSGLPAVRSKNSTYYFKSVENFRDYILQSCKFQKAKTREEQASEVYMVRLDWKKTILICIKYFLKNPFYFIIYLIIITSGRITVNYMPEYTPFWKIYSSSKNLKVSRQI